MNEVAIDVNDRRLAGFLVDYVRIPYFFVQRARWHALTPAFSNGPENPHELSKFVYANCNNFAARIEIVPEQRNPRELELEVDGKLDLAGTQGVDGLTEGGQRRQARSEYGINGRNIGAIQEIEGFCDNV